PFGMAVIRNETDAGFAERAGSVAGNPRIVDAHLAAAAAVNTGGGADKLALAFAFDAGEADDFAGMDDEIDLIEAAPAQAPDREKRGPDRFGLGREDLPERPARDQRNDLGRRDRSGEAAVDDLA